MIVHCSTQYCTYSHNKQKNNSKVSHMHVFIYHRQNKCQYELLTQWDYVWYSGWVAMAEVNGASDPGSIPWLNFINIYFLNVISYHINLFIY